MESWLGCSQNAIADHITLVFNIARSMLAGGFLRDLFLIMCMVISSLCPPMVVPWSVLSLVLKDLKNTLGGASPRGF